MVRIDMPYLDVATQQHGSLHASTIVAIAGSCAAHTLMPAGTVALLAEQKINLLAPAVGEHFYAVGRVKTAVTLVATIMTVRDRGIVD